jgi:hypothetical protein
MGCFSAQGKIAVKNCPTYTTWLLQVLGFCWKLHNLLAPKMHFVACKIFFIFFEETKIFQKIDLKVSRGAKWWGYVCGV